ncbi:MAG: cohesin domain-containing protein [Acidobacteriota bacterium]
MRPATLSTSLRFVAVLGALLLAACSGSGDGGGSGPTSPSPMIVLTPDRAAGAGSIALRVGAGSTASVLQLEIVATEVPGIQAVDFLLLVPSGLLRFDSFTRGDLIGAGAQVIFGGAGSDTLSFQILRTVQATPPDSGLILTLTFTATAAGTGRFDFAGQLAEDLNGLTIPGIDWIGGTVQVVQ